VADQHDPADIDARLAGDQADRRERLWRVLVEARNPSRGGELLGAGQGDLVEACNGDPTTRQSPGEVLERLVGPDRLVAAPNVCSCSKNASRSA
jgi:hypothetical protein